MYFKKTIYKSTTKIHQPNPVIRITLPLILCTLLAATLVSSETFQVVKAQTDSCTASYQPVAVPLTDLGTGEYIRDGQPTGFIGGLYPGGNNQRPSIHNTAGIQIANSITPLNRQGIPDSDGKVVMISLGMSNAQYEFLRFIELANMNNQLNPNLIIINGALPNQTADRWSDPDPDRNPWDTLLLTLQNYGVTPQQVQIAWVKNTLAKGGPFPDNSWELQAHLEIIAQKLKDYFPNIKLSYYSSRTRSYSYENRGLSPEPSAYETGFAVRWMIEKQINGDSSLNYDPVLGDVVAPYLAWGPYFWADGTQPRSDGLTWLPQDLTGDCTHPSESGIEKAANMLLEFFSSDETATPWFLFASNPPPPSTPTRTILPIILETSPITPDETNTAPALAPPRETSTNTPNNLQNQSKLPAGATTPSRVVLLGMAIGAIFITGIILLVLLFRRRG